LLKKEYPIEDRWVSYELHPETPSAGMLLSERFAGRDLAPFYAQLRARGDELGLVFKEQTLLSNSRMALQASEYARDRGFYDAFHENMFRAYLSQAKDIGDPQVIAAVAEASGLDGEATLESVRDERYAPRLTNALREGRQLGLTGIPLFVINGKYKVVGAQPAEIFRHFLEKMK